MFLEPIYVASLGICFHLPEERNDVRFETGLARVRVRNHRFNIDRNNETISSYQPRSPHLFAR